MNWEIGLPLPPQYIGVCDKIFYYIAYLIGGGIDYIGISPNMISLFGLICNLTGCMSIWNDTKFYIPAFFFACVADTMDGYNARRFNKKSCFGALIDHTTDWISAICITMTVIGKWYNYFLFWLFFVSIMQLERYNLLYCGYVLQYHGDDDIQLSKFFQKDASDWANVKIQLVRYKEYNSSLISNLLICLYIIMQAVAEQGSSA